MRYLAPEAAASYMRIEKSGYRLRVSDMLRSAESSLQAAQEKRGVMPPGRSGHNFGFSIDVDVQWLLKQYHWSKQQLDTELVQQGWYCHRKDHAIDSECWHYNYFGPDAPRYLAAAAPYSSTSAGLELMIQDRYGSAFMLTPQELQTALRDMKLYAGEIDGDLGPLSRQAIKALQRAWRLPETGLAGPDTQRLLAFISSQRTIVPLAGSTPLSVVADPVAAPSA
jgi:hypothetical protein